MFPAGMLKMKRVYQCETLHSLISGSPKYMCLASCSLGPPRAGSPAPVTLGDVQETKAAAQLPIILAKCVINLKTEEKKKVKFALWQGSRP